MKTNTKIKTITWVAFNAAFAIAALSAKNPDMHMWAIPLIVNCIIILLNNGEDE